MSSFPVQEGGITEHRVNASLRVICKVLGGLIEVFNTSGYICFKYYIVERISFHDVFYMVTANYMGLPCYLRGNESACNAGDTGDSGCIARLGQSLGGGNGNPL